MAMSAEAARRTAELESAIAAQSVQLEELTRELHNDIRLLRAEVASLREELQRMHDNVPGTEICNAAISARK